MDDSIVNFESVPIGENLELLSLIPGLADDLKPVLDSLTKSLENQNVLQKKISLVDRELESLKHRNNELSLIIDGMIFRMEGLNKQNERLLKIVEKFKKEENLKEHIQKKTKPDVSVEVVGEGRYRVKQVPELEVNEMNNLEVQLTDGQLFTYGKAELVYSDSDWTLTTVSSLSRLETQTNIYLVTNEDFDWSRGTIRVSCPKEDVEFDFSNLTDGYFTVKSSEDITDLSFTLETE